MFGIAMLGEPKFFVLDSYAVPIIHMREIVCSLMNGKF